MLCFRARKLNCAHVYPVGALTVGLAAGAIDPDDRFRFHKTSRRQFLDDGRQGRPDCDEVLFVNRRGELTEGSYHTLVLKLGGRLLTPRLDCGLLPGVLREELLEVGAIREAVLTLLALPAMYAAWFRVRPGKSGDAA